MSKESSPLTDEKITHFLKLQQNEITLKEKELEVKVVELDIRKTELETNAKTAEKSIDAEKEIHTLRQKHSLVVHGNRKSIIIIAMLLFTGASITALVYDKEDVLLELIKLAAVAVASGIGGYGLGKSNKNKNDN